MDFNALFILCTMDNFSRFENNILIHLFFFEVYSLMKGIMWLLHQFIQIFIGTLIESYTKDMNWLLENFNVSPCTHQTHLPTVLKLYILFAILCCCMCSLFQLKSMHTSDIHVPTVLKIHILSAILYCYVCSLALPKPPECEGTHYCCLIWTVTSL